MNNPRPPSIIERSSLLRLFRSLLTWRVQRRLLVMAAWVATIIALFYGEENWWGGRAWNQYRKKVEARGGQLDFKAFIPKSVPEDQNFAATPVVKSWFDKTRSEENEKRWKDNYSQAQITPFKPRQNTATSHEGGRSFTDLAGWQKAFAAIASNQPVPRQEPVLNKADSATRATAAMAVLEALKSNEAILSELREASSRPFARYPVNYDAENPWAILLPHLSNLRAPCQRLQLRACAELVLGRVDQAFDDVKLMFYLADSVKGEPILISYLVRLSCLHLATQPIWEGLAEHRWSESQLNELQSRFESYDLLGDMIMPLEAERAASILTIDIIRNKGHLTSLLNTPNDPTWVSAAFRDPLTDLICWAAPRGWFSAEKRTYCETVQGYADAAFDISARRVYPSRSEAHAVEINRLTLKSGLGLILHHSVAVAILLPELNKLVGKAAAAQTAADEAAMACALERYRIATGQFPEKLEGLAPQFATRLPHDLITGEPYKYKRVDRGSFQLYSLGWNEKDDGGIPGNELFDKKSGDWIWEYPKE